MKHKGSGPLEHIIALMVLILLALLLRKQAVDIISSIIQIAVLS